MADEAVPLMVGNKPYPIKLVDNEDGTYSISVSGGTGGGGGDSVDREVVVTYYRAKNAFTGASVGDTITSSRVLDVSGGSASQVGSTIWYNETTAAALAGAPSAANIEQAGIVGLTDAQLRATAVAVAPASQGYTSKQTVTRAANITAYAANDVVGGVVSFAGIGPVAGHLMLTSCDLRYDVAAVPSGMLGFRLHLYDATPPSAYADNAAWELASGDRANYLGYVDLGTPADFGSTLFTQDPACNRQVKLGAGETTLYGYLVTLGSYTPANNSEVLVPTIRAMVV